MDWNTHPFAGDYLLVPWVQLYRDALGVDCCVETGTNQGATTRLLSALFRRVISIEINPELFRLASDQLADCRNVELVLGDSAAELDRILPSLDPQASLFFFLDAHGYGYGSPLRPELEAIAARRGRQRDVVSIHDFKVPDCPWLGFDSFDGQDVDLDGVREQMDRVFPGGWIVRCNSLASGAGRGCAFFTGI